LRGEKVENKKKLIIGVMGIVLLGLFLISGLKLLRSNKNPTTGQSEISDVTFSRNISNTFSAVKKDPAKITLLDSYDAVITVLGKPNTVAETQGMFDPGSPDPFAGDLYLQYDNFLVMLRENKVAGWYFDPQKISDKNTLFYLPELKVAVMGSFSDMYQAWDSLDSLTQPDIFKVFDDLNGNFLGEFQACTTWGWEDNSTIIAFVEISFFNEKYRIRQQYDFCEGALISKIISTEEPSLIQGEQQGRVVLLGQKIAYIKTFLGPSATLMDPKDYAAAPLKEATMAVFKKGDLHYFLTFNKKGVCIAVQVTAS
jgi:hypothetical protein